MFLHFLGHFSEIPSVGFHPLGSIRCQRCREVDLEGHWVQLRAHLIGFKRLATIYFFLFKIWLKKLFFSLNFPIKKHAFPAFPSFFGHFFGRLHHLPLWTSPWDFHPVVGSVLFRTSSIPRTSSLNVSPGKSPSLRNGRVQVPEPSSVNFYSC